MKVISAQDVGLMTASKPVLSYLNKL